MKMFLAILSILFCFSVSSFASINNETNPNVSVVELGSVSTTATDIYGLYLPVGAKILGFYVVDTTGIAASDTDYITLSLKSGSTVVATYDSRAANQGALVALTPKAGVVSSTNSVLLKGSYLKVNYVEAGTVAMATAKAFILWSVK